MGANTGASRAQEQHRLECEARHWLDIVGTKKADVDALITRISKKRGEAEAKKLLEEMRRQHKARATA